MILTWLDLKFIPKVVNPVTHQGSEIARKHVIVMYWIYEGGAPTAHPDDNY